MVEEVDLTLPLSSYSYEFKSVISKLDPRRILTTDGPNRLLRDWRGLAYLLNIPNDRAVGISEGPDRTVKVLDIWIQRDDGTATLDKLLGYLAQMDRYDIYDDLVELAKMGKIMAPLRFASNDLVPMNSSRDEDLIITHDDRRDGVPNYYHAYVLFAQEDWSFVRELLARMKAANYKLCTEYDIELGYGTQYAPVAQLMLERCYRIILVYSPEFLKSPANRFYSNYAQAVGIESNQRNIIPIVYRDCQLPHNLMYYHKLIYNQDNEFQPFNFWLKLEQTLAKVKLPTSYPAPPPTETEDSDLRQQFLTDFTKIPYSSASVSDLPSAPDFFDYNITTTTLSSDIKKKKKKKKRGLSKIFNYLSVKLKG